HPAQRPARAIHTLLAQPWNTRRRWRWRRNTHAPIGTSKAFTSFRDREPLFIAIFAGQRNG
ncbi:MAG: hypothetical protein WBG34_07335, partial [Flavobacteriales bacterium]